MNDKLVSVIVVDYHGQEVLEKCLHSIFASSYPDLEVIIVDNSNDGCSEEASKKFGLVPFASRRNLGYSGGNNFGLEKAHGEFVMFLNYDAILHPDAISKLVEAANKSHSTLCTPKILMMDHPQIINSIGIQIHMAGFGILRGCGEEDLGQYDKKKENFTPHGACFFASKNNFRSLGCFDNHFFAFNEDTDTGWKALLMDKNVTYVPSAIVYHKMGHSWNKAQESNKIYFAERNRLTMILTNYQRRTMVLLLPIFVLAEASSLAYCTLRGMLGSKIKGYVDLIHLRHYIKRRRRWIQSVRKKSDSYIVKSFTLDYKHTLIGTTNKPINKLFNLIGSFLKHFID